MRLRATWLRLVFPNTVLDVPVIGRELSAFTLDGITFVFDPDYFYLEVAGNALEKLLIALEVTLIALEVRFFARQNGSKQN